MEYAKGEERVSVVFWVEVVSTMVFILNSLPTKSVKGMTPFVAWHDWKPDMLK